MTKIKVEKSDNYTVIDNDTLQDRRLSFKARGLLAYMLSLPEDWDYSVAGLQTASDIDGRDSTAKALKELENLGYIKRHKKFKSHGHFDGYEYIVYEKPITDSPFTEKPITDSPFTENPQQQNKYITKKEITNKEITKEVADVVVDDIETLEAGSGIISSKSFNIYRLWEENIGGISSILAEKLSALVEETSEAAVARAIEKAVYANARNMYYVEAAARGIHSGKDFGKKQQAQDGEKKYGFFG